MNSQNSNKPFVLKFKTFKRFYHQMNTTYYNHFDDREKAMERFNWLQENNCNPKWVRFSDGSK